MNDVSRYLYWHASRGLVSCVDCVCFIHRKSVSLCGINEITKDAGVVMKSNQKNIVRTIALTFACSVCAILFCICFVSSQRWVLPFRGQQELLLYDWGYVKGILMHPGGFTELAAKFLVQFFTVPGVGIVTTLLILGLNAWMVWKIMERTASIGGRFSEASTSATKDSQRKVWGISPLCLLPSAFLAVSFTKGLSPTLWLSFSSGNIPKSKEPAYLCCKAA